MTIRNIRIYTENHFSEKGISKNAQEYGSCYSLTGLGILFSGNDEAAVSQQSAFGGYGPTDAPTRKKRDDTGSVGKV